MMRLRVAVLTAIAGLALSACSGRYYASTGESIDIPASGVITTVIDVPDEFSIEDVDVGLWVRHDHLADLEAWLTSPQGTVVPLFMDLPGRRFNGTWFNDEASEPVDAGESPYRGTWRLHSSIVDTGLWYFDAEPAAGRWTLTVQDHRAPYAGTFYRWRLRFNGD